MNVVVVSEDGKMLCNFQQIEFLFLFDGDYNITFASTFSLLFSDFLHFLSFCLGSETLFEFHDSLRPCHHRSSLL